MDDKILIQHVSFATRFREGQTLSTLDLIITRDDVQLDNLIVDAPLGKSDHVICVLNLCVVSVFLVHAIGDSYLFENGDYDQFNSELTELDWNVCFMV